MKKHKWIRKAMARRFIVAVLLIVQLALLLLFIASSTAASKWIPFFLSAISICVGIHVINERGKPGFKMTWLFTVLIFPVFGGLLYLLATRQASGAYVRRRLCKARAEATGRFEKDAQLLSTAAHAYPACATQQRYLQSFAGFPIYQNTAAVYYPSGEGFYDALLADLQQAERYIFLEFFIIEEGVMWNSILEVLRKKAEAGLDVRLMFDDMGCFLTLPKEYPKYLESMGIKCQVFSPFTPVLSVLQNNRDHRKIASIDGKVAFT
ncbi:MAG: PLDc N-terminal domain-containing protein, partial [Clostridium sp.]|nr:PLDc N-terminal domain-containing protein [Clostridium sp.]